MDAKRAKELLEILADGVNPLTGEILPDGDSCNQAEIVRALHVAVKTLEVAEKRSRPQPENAGKPWTVEDDKALCEMFDLGYSKKDIAAHFKRSGGSIAARLVRLGRISDRYQLV